MFRSFSMLVSFHILSCSSYCPCIDCTSFPFIGSSAACVERIMEVLLLCLEGMVRVHCLSLSLLGMAVGSWGLPSSFMLVSGVTLQEMCLVGVKEVGVIVDACEKAISKLDGREIWILARDGSLTSTGSSKCLGAFNMAQV